MSIEYTHMVVSLSASRGQEMETFHSLDEAEAFAEALAEEGTEEGEYYDIYVGAIARRVRSQPAAAAEDFGVRSGLDYPLGLSGRPGHWHAA